MVSIFEQLRACIAELEAGQIRAADEPPELVRLRARVAGLEAKVARVRAEAVDLPDPDHEPTDYEAWEWNAWSAAMAHIRIALGEASDQ